MAYKKIKLYLGLYSEQDKLTARCFIAFLVKNNLLEAFSQKMPKNIIYVRQTPNKLIVDGIGSKFKSPMEILKWNLANDMWYIFLNERRRWTQKNKTGFGMS